MPKTSTSRIIWLLAIFLFFNHPGFTQPVTGIWRGKVHEQNGLNLRNLELELKLVRDGDSLTGTSYYYTSDHNYARFKVSGYINPYDGTITWWDETPVKDEYDNNKNLSRINPLHYVTDFNCPGEGIMKLDGVAEKNNADNQKKMPVHLKKVDEPFFQDEWDYVLENYARGANDPAVIDSIEQLIIAKQTETKKPINSHKPMPEPVTVSETPAAKPLPARPVPKPAMTVEEMFASRKKVLFTEIPVSGDTLELRFYDHAEIDGDSISLFLNNHLLQKNILLKASPYIVRLPVSELGETNELIMVAENLGSIPPNTSLMITYINDVRYEARLESTENSSAMIRFYKPSQAAKTALPKIP